MPLPFDARQEELLGRLIEQYQRQGEEMPMGLKLLGDGWRCERISRWISRCALGMVVRYREMIPFYGLNLG